jgi:hypothetical protein
MSNRPMSRAERIAALELGISPHGLAAGLPVPHQETLGAPFCLLSAKPVLTSPEVYRSPQVQESCRIIQAAAVEHYYPLVLSASQMKRVERALSLAIDDAIQAMSDEPEGRHEIQPHIDAYNEIYLALRSSRQNHKAHKGGQGNDHWRGGEL